MKLCDVEMIQNNNIMSILQYVHIWDQMVFCESVIIVLEPLLNFVF